jgi:hypothetical protein
MVTFCKLVTRGETYGLHIYFKYILYFSYLILDVKLSQVEPLSLNVKSTWLQKKWMGDYRIFKVH